MGSMPATVTVWAVELERGSPLDEVEGLLSLEGDALVFTPSDRAISARRFPLAALVKVRRLRGSPVLMVHREEGAAPSRTAFYFVPPPPLARPEVEREQLTIMRLRRDTGRKARRRNAGYLGVLNKEKKAILREWERAVGEAAAAARR